MDLANSTILSMAHVRKDTLTKTIEWAKHLRKRKLAKRNDELITDGIRLKPREIKEWREKLYEKQGGKCALCGHQIAPDRMVLDHCHSSGRVRGTLHSGCNAILGKVENNYRRCGISLDQLAGIAPVLVDYISADHSENPYHPSHRTAEEKRLSRNKKARDRRAKKRPVTKRRSR